MEGRSPRERAIELADIIQSIYGLGYIQRNALEEVILKTYERYGIVDENSSTWNKPAPTFIVIDEAHLLFRRSRSKALISRLLMESRKYGIGMIIISQQPLDLNESVILNTSIKVVFNIGEHRNLDYISKSLAGYLHNQKINALKIAISNLPKYHAVANIENKKYLVDTSILLKLNLKDG